MKMTRGIVSILLIAALLIPTASFASSFTDVADTESYVDAVNFFHATGIIKGYENGDFQPEKDVSRAEFTTMLLRAMALEEVAATMDISELPFDDLTSPDISYAIPNIKFAYERGIIVGTGERQFEPEANVKFEEAVKMIVCAAGYEVIAVNDRGGWPHGYTSVANEKGILTDVNGVLEQPAKRWQTAQLLYNALNVDLMTRTFTSGGEEPRYSITEGKTWLTEHLQIQRSTGTLIADEVTSISAVVYPATGEIVIEDDKTGDNLAIRTNGKTVSGLVGRRVEFFYKMEGNRRALVYIKDETSLSSLLTINYENISSYSLKVATGGTIKYWADKDKDLRESSVVIEANATYMLNGKVFTPTDAELKSTLDGMITGSIELADPDNNGSYDRVYITAIDVYVIKSINVNDLTITDNYRVSGVGDGNTLEIDESDANIRLSIKRGASEIAFGSLQKWDVLEVKRTRTTGVNTMDITVTMNRVSGSITGVDLDNDKITIGTTTYTLSPYYKKFATGPSDGLDIGTNGDFYLDSQARICAVDKKAAAINYGYISSMAMASGTDDTLRIKLMNQSGTSTMYSISRRIRYDSATMTPKEGHDYLLTTAAKTNKDGSSTVSQLVRFSTDATGISHIITLNSGIGETVSADTLTPYSMRWNTNADPDLVGVTLSKDNLRLVDADGKWVTVNSGTYIAVTALTSSGDPRKGSISDFKKDGQMFKAEVFDRGATGIAGAIVLYGLPEATVEASTPVSILTNTVEAQHSTEGTLTKFDYYSNGSLVSGKWSETVSTFTDKGVQRGDVFKFVDNANGLANKVEKLYDVRTSTASFGSGGRKEKIETEGTDKYVTVAGYVYGMDGNSIAVCPKEINQIDDSFTTFTVTSSTRIVEYNASAATANQFKTYNMNDLDGIINQYITAGKNASEVFCYEVRGNLVLLYIIRK